MPQGKSSATKKIVMGTVTARYLPGWKKRKKDDAYYLASGKLVIDSKGEVSEISFMQTYVDNVRTEDMPKIWTDIDLDTIEGKRVAIACTFDQDYTHPATGVVKHQYKNPTDIQYLDEDEPAQESEEDAPEPTEEELGEPTPAPTPQPMTIDERIAWNSAINNAVHALGSVWSGQGTANNSVSSSSYNPSSDYWLKKVNEIALSLYGLIRRGPVAPVEVAPEEEADTDTSEPEDGVVGLDGEV